MPEKIAARAQQAIRDKVFPGCVVGVIRGGARTLLPFGRLTYEADSATVTATTIYDLASITKSIPTASLALLLIEEGKLHLSDLVRSHIPELEHDHDATIEDLLRYRVHGVQMSTLAQLSGQEIEQEIFAHGFDGPAGESFYTNLPAYLLGIVIERVTKETVDVLAQRHFFGPLNMTATSYPQFLPRGVLGKNWGLPRTPLGKAAPTEVVDGEELRGLPHDESARVFAREGRAVGHAGLFSNAPDLLHFLEALIGDRFPTIIAGAESGLGWEVDAAWMGNRRGEKTCGKTGFTGTCVAADRERDTAFVLLSNRTYPMRPSTNVAITMVRSDIADVVFGH